MRMRRLAVLRQFAAAPAAANAGALPVFLTSALVLQIGADLGFETAGLGVAVGVYFASGALSSALMGRFAERLGPARALRVGALASAVCLGAIAVLESFQALLAVLCLGGFCNALTQPAANLFIARFVAARRRGLALALKQSAIPVATLLGGLAVPLVALRFGWRWAFAGAALLACGAAALVPGGVAPMPDETSYRGRVAPTSAMLLLAASIGFGAAAAGCLAAFVVAGAVRVGIGNAQAGYLAAFASLLAIVVRLLAGARADRRVGGHLRVVIALLLGGASGSVALVFGDARLFLLAVPLAFGAGWGWPGLFNLAVVSHNSAAPGAATGITQTGTYLGAMLGPLLFGWVAKTVSWDIAWSMVVVWFLLAALTTHVARSSLRASTAAS